MRRTGVAVLCQRCSREFEVFADDGTPEDSTAIWNWCPHCGKQNQLWLKFLNAGAKYEEPPLGISYEQAAATFGKNKSRLTEGISRN